MSQYSEEAIAKQKEKIQQDIAALPEDRREFMQNAINQVQKEFDQNAKDLDTQADIEAQWRKASGLHHTEVEKLLTAMKSKNPGNVIYVGGKAWAKTVFNTVVEAPVYIAALQDRVLEISTVENETLIAQLRYYCIGLKNETDKFTKLSSLGLMKLSIKRFFKRG